MATGFTTICRSCDNARRNHTGKIARLAQRIAVLNHYSKGTMKCACCQTGEVEFLTIDHIENEGKRHRDLIGEPLYRFLVRNNFPSDVPLRVLCFSCNQARGFYGCCPHEKSTQVITD